mgnify:CR=1 FL=1
MENKIIYVRDTGLVSPDRTKDVHTLLLNGLRDRGMQASVQAVRVSDIGVYNQGVVIKVLPDVTYFNVKDEDIGRILDALKQEKTVSELASRKEPKQLRIVLRNCGVINPEVIDEYIAVDGYTALGKVLTEMTPEQVIDLMEKSGLRGRGVFVCGGYCRAASIWMTRRTASGMPCRCPSACPTRCA